MRIFLAQWNGEHLGLIDVIFKLKEKYEIVYWIGCNLDKEVDKSQFPTTIFHDHYDALAGIPPKGINHLKFPFLGEDWAEQFADSALMLLTMMGKHYDYMPVDQRKHMCYQYLQYWYGAINRFKPDVIIFPVAPHTVYDFVIYAIAKKMGIKTIMFDTALISDCLLIVNDYKIGSPAISENLEKNKEKNFSIFDLSPIFQEYYKRQTDKRTENTPLYMKKDKSQFQGINLLRLKLDVILKSVKDGTFFKKLVNFITKKFQLDLRKEYLKFQSKPDFNEKYIYIPFNYQPERTTSPQGGVFVDQLLMVEILSAAAPEGWKIYVKEHPIQWLKRGPSFFGYRYKGYYETIAKLKNVKLIPLETDTFFLTDNAQAIATVTGTAGWEATLRLKPVLVFGYPWYKQCPEIFKVKDTESCRIALNKIKNGFKVNQQQVINYLVSLDRTSIKGYLDDYGQEISKISREENTRNLFKALISEIE